MDRPADLLVSEIVDVALLGEHMVPAVEDAQKRGLLADDVVSNAQLYRRQFD